MCIPSRTNTLHEDRRGPKGRLAKGRLAKGRTHRALNHNETYRTPIFCTVPLPKVHLVPSKKSRRYKGVHTARFLFGANVVIRVLFYRLSFLVRQIIRKGCNYS